MTPTLTLILFVDVEKPLRMTGRFVESLTRLNAESLPKLQLIVLCQGDQADELTPSFACDRSGLNWTVLNCGHDMVEGYPVWDVIEQTRRVWDFVVGQYVGWAHPEFFFAGDRLIRTIRYLEEFRPHLAIGNLRRPGNDPQQWKFPSCSRDVSDVLARALDRGDFERARDYCEIMPTREWMYWSPLPKPGDSAWLEDIFFARKDWLDAIGFSRDYGPMPFQDVYDLMQVTIEQLRKRALMPRSVRLSQETNLAIHLWHPKGWSSFTPEMRDYFRAHADKYRGTRLIDWQLWDRLIACRGAHMPKDEQPVIHLRRGPAGTVTRFALGIAEYLKRGGRETVQQYYREFAAGQKTSRKALAVASQ